MRTFEAQGPEAQDLDSEALGLDLEALGLDSEALGLDLVDNDDDGGIRYFVIKYLIKLF